MTRNEFIAKDGKKISYLTWADVENPIGVIQVVHGMVEHAGRYDLFAREMNKRGFIVAADDHRAHGVTDESNLGYSEGNIWENTLSDLKQLNEILKKEYGLPIVLFGHSYGSFLSQAYVRRNDGLAGAVIGGSNYFVGPTVTFGRFFAGCGMKFKGKEKPAYMLKKASFDSYNKNFANGTFISSLPEECKRYESDKYCNFICSHNFYHAFFGGVSKLYAKEGRSLKDFPILLVAGKDDPVGNMGKGVEKLERWYKKQGASVRAVIYPGVRHEFLNDTSRAAVIKEIGDFATACVKVNNK